jgi:hypothetical protein
MDAVGLDEKEEILSVSGYGCRLLVKCFDLGELVRGDAQRLAITPLNFRSS